MGSPLAWIVLVAGVLHAVGIGWGLPASDGWDNDGVAPRDFLAGLVLTFRPGSYFTYPPFHLALLALLTLPITLVALARAPSLHQADVVAEILRVPYMTSLALVARLVSLAMSLGIVVLVARIAEELRAASLRVADPALGADEARADPRVRRAGWAAAAVAAVNASLTYYAHTTNLDVPYLFWGTAGVLAFVRALAREEPVWLRRGAVLAVLGIATKDQAYALFLLSVPLVLVAWLAVDRASRGRVAREAVVALGLGLALLLVVDVVLVNPAGFRARVAFLLGSASQDFAQYEASWRGRLRVLQDIALYVPRYYPWPFVPAVVGGLGVALGRARGAAGGGRACLYGLAAAFPLLAAASFTVAFNWAARRTEHRFLMPQSIMVAVYAGLALEPLAFAARRWLRLAARAVLVVAFGFAIFACGAVDAQLVLDPRYDAERWLREHSRPEDTIETYGLNVYLPRMPEGRRVVRVGPEPPDQRNPMPGFVEVQDVFQRARERGARFIVVSEAWVWRHFVITNAPLEEGRVIPPTNQRGIGTEAHAFFYGLEREQQGYRWAYRATYKSAVWPRLDIHASTSRDIWILERMP